MNKIITKMKIQTINPIQFLGAFLLFFAASMLMTSCKKDETKPTTNAPVASFQFQISTTNFLEVTFSNFSKDATSYSWNFGDTKTSTEQNPVHTYAAAGTYTVELTASNAANETNKFSQTVVITDPNSALALLAGTNSKTWKLYRTGSSLGVGPNAGAARSYFALTNNGSRPCVYNHSFTFHRNGDFVFNDAGMFWGEAAAFSGTANFETCFAATAGNMVNKDGKDVSAWLGGTHAYTYNASTGKITLNGMGAWMGLPQLGTAAESSIPEASRTFSATITQETGYDVLTISYTYTDLYWDFTYVSYSDPSLEPDVVTTVIPFGEDLVDVTPTQMFNTFASTGAADVKELVPTASAVTINIGADDPANPAGTKVGQYVRGTEAFADLKFQLAYDCQFDNFTTLSVDVYIPSTNVYSAGGLTTGIQMWIADASQTQEFWTNWVQYDVAPGDIVVDQWKTYTFPLGDALNRKDLDLVGLVIGGSNHAVNGTFYVRNLMIK